MNILHVFWCLCVHISVVSVSRREVVSSVTIYPGLLLSFFVLISSHFCSQII